MVKDTEERGKKEGESALKQIQILSVK